MSDAPPPPAPDVFHQSPKHLTPAVQSALRRYWRTNLAIMIALLSVWAFVGLGCGVLFADTLNQFKLGGYPLGFWFAQQGSIITFVLIILIYATAMNWLDKKHHREISDLRNGEARNAQSGGDA